MDGAMDRDGWDEGDPEGTALGCADSDGAAEMVGANDGIALGPAEGLREGCLDPVGVFDGSLVDETGGVEGLMEGTTDGASEGEEEGVGFVTSSMANCNQAS